MDFGNIFRTRVVTICVSDSLVACTVCDKSRISLESKLSKTRWINGEFTRFRWVFVTPLALCGNLHARKRAGSLIRACSAPPRLVRRLPGKIKKGSQTRL